MNVVDMMTSHYRTLTHTLRAIAHPARLQILDMLRDGEICVCEIEQKLGQRQAYVSQQLIVLRNAGLVRYRKEGLRVYYSLTEASDINLLNAIYAMPRKAHHSKG